MAKRSVNHHIVPQVLQKQFAINGDSERIYRSKRGADGKFSAPKPKKIEKTFVLRNYNTIIENDMLSDKVEREFYGDIDNYLGEVIPNIVAAINKNEIPQFTKPALDSFRQAVIKMVKRTPDSIVFGDDESIGLKFIEETNKALRENHPHLLSGVLKFLNAHRPAEHGRSIRNKASLKPMLKVEKTLSEFTIKWAVINSKHSFILSSMMAYRVGNSGSNGLSNPNVEIWMPISPKIAAVLVRDRYNKLPDVYICPRDQIRNFNEYAIENSFEIASHSEQLLRSLLSCKNSST